MTDSQKDQSHRWSILIPCMTAMLAIANLQYAWTFFTTDITKALHVRLDAVQWTLTFFIIAQTALFPINAYLVDRFGPRLIVTFASLLIALGWVGAGIANSLPALYVTYSTGAIGARAGCRSSAGVSMTRLTDPRGPC